MTNDTFSANALDLFQIAVRVAGFDRPEMQRRVMAHPLTRKINVRTVERWMSEMYESDPANAQMIASRHRAVAAFRSSHGGANVGDAETAA